MRFLMLTTFYPPFNFGGDGAYVFRLTNELARRGHDVHVVHCADAFHMLDRREPPAGVTNHANVTVHTLRSGAGLLSPLITQQTGRAGLKAAPIKSLVEHGRFDVVHYHNMSLIGLDVLCMGDAVKLYTTHEHWLVCPTHVLWRYNRELCTTQTCFTCQVVAGRPPQWWRYTGFADRCLGEVDRFLCPSRFTLNKHREMGFSRPMTHLPYFLPRKSAAATSDVPPHPRPYALFVGRLEKIKGVHNLVDAFRSYNGCDLIIVGSGEYEDELRARAAGLAHVRFAGRLPYEAIREWYRHALAVVVPSICYEVFGIIMIEGFAMGTPALVTPLGALPEVIEDSGGGAVYYSNAELIALLERLRTDRPWRDALGRRGHDAYLRLWSEDPHIAQYMDLIDEISRHKRGRGESRVADRHEVDVSGPR